MTVFRLRQFPWSARLVIALFAAVIGLGYLTALSHMYLTYENFDGKPGVTDRDVKMHLLGDRSSTLLEQKITVGTMRQYIEDDAERATVLAWIHNGARETDFSSIEPILKNRCTGCHSHNGAAAFRPLTTYEEVHEVAEPDMGESIQAWARIAHEHIPPLSMMYLLLGLLFSFTAFPVRLKPVIVAAPFVALVVDFGSRALARYAPALVYGVLLGGVVMAVATLIMVVTLLYEVLLCRPEDPSDVTVEELDAEAIHDLEGAPSGA